MIRHSYNVIDGNGESAYNEDIIIILYLFTYLCLFFHNQLRVLLFFGRT